MSRWPGVALRARIVSRVLAASFGIAILTQCAKAQVALDGTGMTGALEVVVVDSFGNPLDQADVEIRTLNGSSGQAGVQVDRTQDGRLPYGSYRVTATRTAFYPASKTVIVNKRATTVVMGLVPAEIEVVGVITLKGEVRGAGALPDCLVLRLIPLIGAREPLDVKISGGRFTVEDAKPGKYVAVLLGPEGVCRTSFVNIYLAQRDPVIVP